MIYTIENYKLAKQVSGYIWETFLLEHKDYNPFNLLEDDLKLLPNDKLKNRYKRCKLFMSECFNRIDDDSELSIYLYRYELS